MKVTLERIYGEAYVLRIHPDFEANPNIFIGSASVEIDTAGVAMIRALVVPEFTRGIYRAVETSLAGIGVGRMVWDRRNIGDTRHRSQSIRSTGVTP